MLLPPPKGSGFPQPNRIYENTLPINADVTEAMVNMCDIIVNTSARYDIQQKMQIKDFMEKFLLTMKENQEENC